MTSDKGQKGISLSPSNKLMKVVRFRLPVEMAQNCMAHQNIAITFHLIAHSKVSNKRGMRKIGVGGWKWFDITIIREVEIIQGYVWKNRSLSFS